MLQYRFEEVQSTYLLVDLHVGSSYRAPTLEELVAERVLHTDVLATLSRQAHALCMKMLLLQQAQMLPACREQ